jgi:branched-chain amino acid transport system permease protein
MLPPVFGVLFDGFAYGMLLFLLAVGLTVTLGMMNFINLAHCAFAMLGGYITVSLMAGLDVGIPAFTIFYVRLPIHFSFPGIHFFSLPPVPFFATLPIAFCVTAGLAIMLERTLYRRLYRASDLDQVLLTIGIVFVSVAIAAYLFGTAQQPVELPGYLRSSFNVAGIHLVTYRVILIAIALAITGVVALGLEYTRFGAQIRASVDNERMARGLGINVERTFAITFALGSGLAGLGGALAIEIVGLDPNFAFTYLIYVLIVVSTGGLGSVAGSFAAAAVLGISDVAGKYYVPQIGAFLIYLVMIGLLMLRPNGLFGRR